MHRTTRDTDDVITLPAAARLLGVGPTTLKRWSDQGRIPHTRTPGGHRRFLRSVILDFRALVDPRAGVGQTPGHLSLRMGEPREWVDRAHTLADADRMEAALLALRAGYASWGETADAVLREFLDPLDERQRAGQLSLGAWAAVRRSLVRSANRAAGRLRPRIGAPVAVLAGIEAGSADVLSALAETVLREQGFTVLDLGAIAPDALAQVIDEQLPHLVVLLADRSVGSAVLGLHARDALRAAARGGAELWYAGEGDWPTLEATLRMPSFATLGVSAGRRVAGREGPTEVVAR
jgi:excisionase family DNA binding protein